VSAGVHANPARPWVGNAYFLLAIDMPPDIVATAHGCQQRPKPLRRAAPALKTMQQERPGHRARTHFLHAGRDRQEPLDNKPK